MYELILMDFSMPLMDGCETAQLIIKEINKFYARKHISSPSRVFPYICCLTAYT